MKNKSAAATIAALVAQLIFGLSFMFTKIALGHASPMTVVANRYIVAFAGLTAAAIITKTKINLKRNILPLIIMSTFQPLLYFIFESYGIRLTTSSFSSVMIAMIPVAAMLCGIFVLKEIPSPMQYVFAAISVLGVVLIAMEGSADGFVSPGGILLLAGAVLSAVGYNVMSRKISSEFSPFERTYAMSIIGVVSFSAIAVVENIRNPYAVISAFSSAEYVAAIMYLGILASVVAFLLLNFANTHLPVVKTTVFSNFTTVVSVFAGAVFLGEPVSAKTWLCVFMIAGGVLGVQLLGVKKY